MRTEYITLQRNFGSDLMSQVGSTLTGGALGLGFGAIGGAIQSGQQGKMLQQQEQMNEKFANYSMGLQKDMWDYTNYENQVKHLNEAGLNPALLYGKSGGGGTTTGSVSAPAGMGIAMNPGAQAINAETQADINLKNAQAKNIEADTTKKTGVDTEAVQTTIDNMKQSTKNAEIQNGILQWEAGIKAAEATVATQTIDTAVQSIHAQYDKLIQEIRSTKISTDLTEATKDSLIQQAKNATIQQGLNMILTKAQTQGLITDIEATKNAINMAIQKNMREWDTQPNMSLEMRTKQFQDDLLQNQTLPNMGEKVLQSLSHFLIPIIGKGPKPNPIGFQQKW